MSGIRGPTTIDVGGRPGRRTVGVGPEPLLEATGRTDEEIARGVAGEVRQRVVDASRNEQRVSSPAHDPVLPDLEGQLALEDAERLVEGVVMERRPGPAGLDAILDDPDRPTCVLGRESDPGGDQLGHRPSTTISVLPSGSRNQNSGGTGSPKRLTSASTSTPRSLSCAW